MAYLEILVDEGALLQAFRGRQSRCGWTGRFRRREPPSFNPELAAHPASWPRHTAGATYETIQRGSRVVVESLMRLERGAKIEHTVSMEDGFLSSEEPKRS